MSLRSKLVLAFLLLAIVPLSALTLYSYYSSITTFRRVAEAESAEITNSMSQRMEVVTNDLNRRLHRLQNVPFQEVLAEQAGHRRPSARLIYRQVMNEFGDMAGLVSRLEFLPAPAAPEGREGTPPPPPLDPESPPPPPPGSVAGAPPGPGPRPDSLIFNFPNDPQVLQAQLERQRARIVELERQQRELQQNAESPQSEENEVVIRQDKERLIVEAADVEKLTQQLTQKANEMGKVVVDSLSNFTDQETAATVSEQLGKTLAGVGQGLKDAMGRALSDPGVRAFLGRTLDSVVQVSGQPVGTIRAQLNPRQMMGRVFLAARRRQGEIPFAVDPEGNLYTAREEDRQQLEHLQLETLAKQPQLSREMGDWLVVTRQDSNSGMIFGIARPIASRLKEIQRTAVYNLLFGLGIVGIALVGILPLSGRMTRNLDTLTRGARQLATGDLQTRVPVKSKDEFGKLALTFNQMAIKLKQQQDQLVEQERLRKELEMCRLIQEELLPQHPLRLPFAEVKGVSIPAREVGGDFFNYFPLSGGKIAILIGDVSGKGVAAALLMANLQATLRARVPVEPDLAKLAGELDREIHSQTPPASYLTLFLGILDGRSGLLRWVNAGHNPQYGLLSGGEVRKLESGGRPLGLIPGGGFVEGQLSLGPGESLFLYTDGLVESENEEGEEFGEARLERVLQTLNDDSTDSMLARIEESVRDYREGREAGDDATMVVLRIAGHSIDVAQSNS